MRDTVNSRNNYHPFPVRLKDLKTKLQKRAYAEERSLHAFIILILRKNQEEYEKSKLNEY